MGVSAVPKENASGRRMGKEGDDPMPDSRERIGLYYPIGIVTIPVAIIYLYNVGFEVESSEL